MHRGPGGKKLELADVQIDACFEDRWIERHVQNAAPLFTGPATSFVQKMTSAQSLTGCAIALGSSDPNDRDL
jgi:hypothetical protein